MEILEKKIVDMHRNGLSTTEIAEALRAINHALGTKKAHGPNEPERLRHYRIKDYGDGK